MERLRLKFLRECKTNIDLILRNLAADRIASAREEALAVVFRGALSIKGGSSFFGLERIGHLAAEMEGLCGGLLDGTVRLAEKAISALSDGASMLSDLVEAAELGIELVAGYEQAARGRLVELRQ